MDPAQEFMKLMLARQKPMNEVIDRGDSSMQQFYRDATVFVTGGSGFLGKQLIEKLFRSCKIKKMYVLLRPKKGKTIQQRLDYTLKDPVFDVVLEKQPHFGDKIVAVEGDVADYKLGLSDKDRATIIQEVDMVLHMAATIRLDETLRKAVLTNVRGTRDTLELARQCKKLKNFVYVSTAYSHATREHVGTPVLEQFYPSPIAPESLIQLIESLTEDRINAITPELIKGWLNTYTFTKAVAEEMVRTFDGSLPVCIVRPAIVLNSYLEPLPGWLDKNCIMGPMGIILGSLLGVINVLFLDLNIKSALVPVDYVNNAIIAAGWDSAKRRISGDTSIAVYTIANHDRSFKWAYVMRKIAIHLVSPKTLWYHNIITTKNRMLYWILNWLLHYIPAYILDAVCAVVPMKPKGIPPFVKIYSMIDKLSSTFSYFVTHEWEFSDENVKAMINRMSNVDRTIFNCDLTTMDQTDYIKIWFIGVRKYIVKDGLTGSVQAYKKQKIFALAHYTLLSLYIFIFWIIFRVSKIGPFFQNWFFGSSS